MVEIKARAILFDMDGTLVNTIECVERWWREMANKYNIDADKLLHNIHGHPTHDVLNKWFPPELHSREVAQEFEEDLMKDARGVYAVPGISKLLAELDPKKWAIVTAATESLALTRLAQANLPVPDRMVSAKDVTRGKPDPECYRAGAKHLGVDPEEAVVFEDAVNGVKAGHAAGATVVAILTSTDEKELRAAGAQHAIKDFSSVSVVDKGNHLVISF
ncbi:HAD-superfamily hydrolase, subfamily IA, variant 3 [Martensiomyces pterosporus]|nr:HAD-superfamily hydrolase, subfamily IA, variant 3 [Martensiomyces pterosporus]